MKQVCTRCKESKLEDSFYRRADTAKGVRPWCKECCKEVRRLSKTSTENKQRQHLLHRYSLTIEGYEKLLRVQNYKCAICGRKDSGATGKKYLSVDHCHRTGEIRGLLCNACNNGLGRFKDDASLLRRASRYIEQSEGVGNG